ncbi:hypothetical protein C1886_11255 [Pseudomonas sp. FW300-N1A1]|uniref:hypothetical protein n=1 Tax=Pseudomonas sp. FW300-N1A1 TaxID=2075555 RepID=UPI000CD147C9|nr:hypothetical protein [Pseudomonas sp. FW300-N1A1]POA19752.1 hypothetical protein C1886_11255 [Pseudomonas sp. FW300-N1A1]
MNEKVSEQDGALRALLEAYKTDPGVKAANGYMQVEITRGNVVETHKATSFFMGAREGFALVQAYIGDDPENQKEIQLLSTLKLEAGERYQISDDVPPTVMAFYIVHKGGSQEQSAGNGILKVEKFLVDPSKPHIKGTLEFMCRETPFSEIWMKVVAKDFWVEGDLS